MKITVTQNDIEIGFRNNPYLCPIATACQRVGFIHPRVNATGQITSANSGKIWHLPPIAMAFMQVFDEGIGPELKPITFELT